MEIKRLEEIADFSSLHTQRIDAVCDILEEKCEVIDLEYIQELAELCYKEGFKDGYRVADYLHEKTR